LMVLAALGSLALLTLWTRLPRELPQRTEKAGASPAAAD
jgi:predicted MFS family arabinose efflux permease